MKLASSVGAILVGAGAAAAPLTVLPTYRPSFTRHVSPFPVTDSAGRPYPLPFLGGFDSPRPSLVDIDGDGDADLFIQEHSDKVAFLEHVVRGGRHGFEWRTDRFVDLSVGEWYRFVDMDLDGDFDLLAEQPYSYVRYYRNEGSATRANFVLVTDSLRDAAGVPLFADRQNIAQAADLDCNGRVDLMIGRITGNISRYELARFDPAGAPRFTLLTDRFEDIEIVAQSSIPGNPSWHGANTMALVDLDSDRDLDILWGDFFEPGLLYIENAGSCAQPSLRGAPIPFPPANPIRTSGYNAPALGDTDGDGDVDLLVGVIGGAYNPLTTATDNILHLERQGGAWAVTSRRFLGMVDVGSESIPAVADLDGDGDLDVVLGNRVDVTTGQAAGLRVLRNTGTRTAPAFREAEAARMPGFHAAPALGDLDGDGRPDLVLGGFGATVAWYRHSGTGDWPFAPADTALVRITRGGNTVPALADLDGDGDLDLVVGEASGALNYYRNDGDRAAPRFTLVSDEWLGIDVGRRSAPAFADLDGDGDLDLVVGSEMGTLSVWRNEGPAASPQFVADGELGLDTAPVSAPVLADLTGDGVLDLLVGGAGGGLRFYRGGAVSR